MWIVLTFICMLRYYNVESSHIYLYAEALQCGQFSHLPVCCGITMWTVLTFICMLRHYNVDSPQIYLCAKASQYVGSSHLSAC